MRLTNIALALATTASGLALATAAPAVAAPAAHSEVSIRASAAAMARWQTQRHESLGPSKGYFTTATWQRLSGVRVMQVKARCWGNDSQIEVKLWFLRRYGGGEKVAKSGKWTCNGKYGIVRISNAGHSMYWASFNLNKKHTVEYWVQYYK
ncbi:hypothetical protein ACIBQ1_04360 [Nonomuraea sp. NPDC050153]|uniref:hypothetical protein n=1 Tax=Nonomuraea sp. NPDC050153 TaxID=3364359 RepID=UPI0037B2F022